jgi:hypothetical protein
MEKPSYYTRTLELPVNQTLKASLDLAQGHEALLSRIKPERPSPAKLVLKLVRRHLFRD